MLPKINRIKKKKDFETIFKKSKSIKSGSLIFRVLKNDLNLNRFGFVVSQKVSKKAVIRNKVRRRLSEAMRLETGKIKTGTDIILIALPGIDKKEFSVVKKEIKDILTKIGIIA